MTVPSTILRLGGAMLVGLWMAATIIALLDARRRMARSRMVRRAEDPLQVTLDGALSAKVFNLTSLPIWWVDSELRLAGANDAYARAVGQPSPDAAVRAGAELAPQVRRFAAEARAADRAIVGEERVTIEGERRLLEIIAIPLVGGEVAHLALDETRRHAAHTAAALQARSLGDALERMDAAVALFDGAGTLRHHNRVFADMFALDPAWLGTGPGLDQLLDAMRAANKLPEDRDFARWRAQRHGWIASDEELIEEYWSLPGGALLRVRVYPNGGAGPLMIIEDRTEHSRSAARLEQLQSLHTTMLDLLREGVAVFGPDGQLKSFNRRFAEIVLASRAELTANPSADQLMDRLSKLLAEPERAARLRNLIIGATAGRTVGEGRAVSALGYTVDYAAYPLPDGNAVITCIAFAAEK